MAEEGAVNQYTVSGETDVLMKQSEQLLKSLSELEGRIGSVLLPEAPSSPAQHCDGGPAPDSAHCAALKRLFGVEHAIIRAREGVQDMLDRLQL